MERALVIAERGAANEEIPVGALVVAPDGTIVAEAHNESIRRHDPSAHAEILALRRAGDTLGDHRLGGCVLVVTLEPCMMCTGAIREARLAGVVYGASDLAAGAVASMFDGLDGTDTWHMGGIEAQRCADLLRSFFKDRR